MASRPAQVIQIGGQPLNLMDQLTYYYVAFEEVTTAKINDLGLLINGKINSKLRNFSFLVPSDSPVVSDLSWLANLPANSVILDDQIEVPEHDRKLLELFNVQYLSFADREKLAETLILNFFQGQSGFPFQTKEFQIAPNYNGVVEQHGDNTIIFNDVSTDKLQWLGTFSHPLFFLGNSQWEILPECATELEDSQLEFHVHLTFPKSNTEQVVVIKGAKIHETTYLAPFKEGVNVSVSVYGRGPGRLYLGHVHIRKSRNGRGFLLIGGEDRILDQNMNQEINFFFNAGDLKPPLSVYFAGYRMADGFEGNGMMTEFGSPYILVRDPRIIGGDFYVGSAEYEAGIVEYIKEKLSLLGFGPHDLILSGVSMGSFGALYYAADLQPAAVIVGKPLINLGTIAKTTRIKRPNMFDVDWDTLALWAGGTTDEDVKWANQQFRNKFATGNFSQTQFAIAFMKDDDYDHEAFKELNRYLRSSYPQIQLLYRGFLGRHNDNTPAIFKWFRAQYRRILTTEFGRQFTEGK